MKENESHGIKARARQKACRPRRFSVDSEKKARAFFPLQDGVASDRGSLTTCLRSRGFD